jgi:hypothetical protein
MSEETPRFKDAPLGKSLLKFVETMDDFLGKINTNFTSQAAVVAAVGSPTFPSAATIAVGAATVKASLAQVKQAIKEVQ